MIRWFADLRPRRPWMPAVTGALAGLIALALATLSPQVVSFEHSISKVRTFLLSTRPAHAVADVVIVYVDEKSLAPYPYLTPIDRAHLSAVLEKIAAAKPRVIAIDILFDRASEPAKDEHLAQVLRALAVPVVLAFDGSDTIRSFEREFKSASGRPGGYADLATTGSDVTHVPPSIRGQCSFAELTVAQSMRRDCAPSKFYRRIDWLLEPHDGSQTFLQIPSSYVLSHANPAFLRGKIVLLGGQFRGVDRHATPTAKDDDTPGIWIQAQIIQQILDARARHDLGAVGEGIASLAAGALGALVAAHRFSRARGALVATVSGLGIIGLDIALYLLCRVALPGDLILFAFSLGFLWNTLLENQRARGLDYALKSAVGLEDTCAV